eukprot:363203-Chlamydomonas_euryale.AAC.23
MSTYYSRTDGQITPLSVSPAYFEVLQTAYMWRIRKGQIGQVQEMTKNCEATSKPRTNLSMEMESFQPSWFMKLS